MKEYHFHMCAHVVFFFIVKTHLGRAGVGNNMLHIQAINLDSVNIVTQAIQTLKTAENKIAFDADANHAFINELKDTYLCFDLEDFDTYLDWHSASDDLKAFKMVFEGAIKTFLSVDSLAFQFYGTQTPVDNNANGFDVYSVSMVFKHCGDTLVMKNQFTLIRDTDGWEVEKKR